MNETPALTEAEKVAMIHRFGFDEAPDIAEVSERVFIRAVHIAELARDMFKSVS